MSLINDNVFEGYGWRSFDMQIGRAQFELDRMAAAADYDFRESPQTLARRLQNVLTMLAACRSYACNAAHRLAAQSGLEPEGTREMMSIRASLADIVNAVNLTGAASCETYRHRLNIIGNRVSRIQDDLQMLEDGGLRDAS
ncbi:MAG: hypothetical protein KI792_07175 [Alphaproteobacteria bacterium]|nr:hypothetical protein [Alphaproteobacteria bacterium SS10]